ncbi:hypothetical protein [Pseudomonas virus PBPA162]|uniref:Helix-turn-helix domain-containing protein n=3 Tax=Viruses TaxID=10239 RepID=A0A7S5AYX8_9CAUD|nr:hypothetical protein PQC31_gp63 [Pseudomonas phage Iggy]YP_010671838.1 hypothetical protein PQC32_gp75 [Pseudomonas virus PBPA162]QDB70909.1 hypothetical protein [Pseudomonas virus PBPA162]QEA09784.1 hypothetical protein [Pseudomonas phage Iggy]WPK40912.1 hypothetical protein Knedl_CDS0038 [Pseudomonas phage Knedl]
MTTLQDNFDSTYITSTEVCEKMQVSRVTLHYHRKNGRLPQHATLPGGQITIWRRDEMMPVMEEWSRKLYGKVLWEK